MGRPQDVIFGWVVTVSFVAVGLFSLDAFYPFPALLGGSALWSLIWLLVFKKSTVSVPSLSRNDAKYLFLVIAVGLVFRIGPYPYVVGGQDQGVYVNMSYSFEREHGPFHVDPVRSRLTDLELVRAYDEANLRDGGAVGPGTTTFLPGVYIQDLENSEYVFQFYHLHPLWMSMFGGVLGGLGRLYSLTFFSLLSLVAFYLLTLELFGKRLLALVAALLLALNPLHAFFSKFPVTEVVALAFTTASFYYLVRYHRRTRRGDDDWRDLLLAALLLGCMFFTRISGFMYLPTIWLILVVIFVFEEDRRIRRSLVAYCFGVGILYVGSVFYGLRYSYPYAWDIYNVVSFGRVLGPEWPTKLLFLLSLLGIVTMAGWTLAQYEAWRKRFRELFKTGRALLPLAFIAVGILGLVRVYQLAWGGGEFSNWMIAHWDLADKGLHSVLRSSLVVAGSYVSPPLAIFALTGLFYKKRNPYFSLLLAFLFQFIVNAAFILWLIPYQYYYARYLLSEVVPFSIIVAMGGLLVWWTRPRGKKIAMVLLGATTTYYLFFTALQWRGKEAEGAYTALEEITRSLGKDDVLFMERGSFQAEAGIITPLIYLFDKRVAVYENASTVVRHFNENEQGGGSFKEFFILSPWKIESSSLELVSEAVYREGHFEFIPIIPMKFSYVFEFPLFLYKIGDGGFGNEAAEQLAESSLLKEGFHTDGVWTKGSGRLTGFRVDLADKRFIVLETLGLNPLKYDAEKLNLRIAIGEQMLRPHHQEGFRYYFQIPPEVTDIESLTIHSNTFVPKERGINDDERELGIDFKSIDFE